MTVKRMDNVGIVVEDIGVAIDFFIELGLEVEGRATIEGEWAGRITGLGDQNVEVAMMRTPDGHSRLEISRFIRPSVMADHRTTPVNPSGTFASVCGGGPRRHARAARQARCAARRRSGPVQLVPSLLHPRPRRNPDRPCSTAWCRPCALRSRRERRRRSGGTCLSGREHLLPPPTADARAGQGRRAERLLGPVSVSTAPGGEGRQPLHCCLPPQHPDGS
jgi:hypothetical protein